MIRGLWARRVSKGITAVRGRKVIRVNKGLWARRAFRALLVRGGQGAIQVR